jgi:hypothetical protein
MSPKGRGMDLSSEKRDASVAWFRLAELVGRGEKEKALNLYRLLSHSFDDRAYALQVEGDLLWSFEDKGALEKYKQAAFLYKKEQKLAAAISIYEHLFTLDSRSTDVLRHLLQFYVEIDWIERFEDRFSVLLRCYEENQLSSEQTWNIIEAIVETVAEVPESNKCNTEKVISLIQEKFPAASEKVKQILKR